jgi:hypothetical protein
MSNKTIYTVIDIVTDVNNKSLLEVGPHPKTCFMEGFPVNSIEGTFYHTDVDPDVIFVRRSLRV